MSQNDEIRGRMYNRLTDAILRSGLDRGRDRPGIDGERLARKRHLLEQVTRRQVGEDELRDLVRREQAGKQDLDEIVQELGLYVEMYWSDVAPQSPRYYEAVFCKEFAEEYRKVAIGLMTTAKLQLDSPGGQ